MKIKNISKNALANTWYNVMDGAVLTENLSEELDSLTIVIPNENDLKFEPYDLIMFSDNSDYASYWLVANRNKSIARINPTKKYTYTIDLMSVTKWLETVQLPSMAITNIGQNRTIKSYVERVVERYLKPVLLKSLPKAEGDSEIYFNYSGIPNDVICPEFTFQNPSLREYLDALFSKFGGIAKLKFDYMYEDEDSNGNQIFKFDFSIDVFYLTKISGPINQNYLTGLDSIESAEDYVASLSHSIEDVIGQDSIVEYQKPKTDDYLMTTDNACILLNQKIYDIEKFEVSHPTSMTVALSVKKDGVAQSGFSAGVYFTNTDEQGITFSVTYDENYGNPSSASIRMPSSTYWDVTSFLVIPEVFESLSTLSATYYKEHDAVAGWSAKYANKNNALVFERGNKKIDNLFRYYSKQTIIGDESGLTAVSAATSISAYNYFINNQTSFTFTDEHNDHEYTYKVADSYAYEIEWDDSTVYKITYKPYMNARFEMEDGEINSHHVVMQDNSTNASTDIGQYLAQSVEKNSKLGNETLIATARVPDDYGFTYELGEYYDIGNDKYILSTLEKQLKANECLYKFTLTKNFTNRNLNTIINREKRYYALAKDEIVERSEIVYKQYRYIELVLSSSDVSKGLYDNDYGPLQNKYNALSFRTSNNDDAQIATGSIPLNTIIGGNSFILSATFMDNINYKLFPESTQSSGGYPMKQYRYVNNDGEFENTRTAPVNLGATDMINQNYSSSLYPSAFLKDQREKITINFEYIYKASDSRIKIGSHFAEALYKKTNVLISKRYYYTDGSTWYAGWGYGIPNNYSIPDEDWYTNNGRDHVQAIVITTSSGDDVMIIYNPPQSAWFNVTFEDETY